jgi:hypothetical protein
MPPTSSHSLSCTAPGLDTHTADASVSNLFFTHPKNYLGVPLAVDVDGSTGALVVQHLVDLPGRAKRGAQALGLIDIAGNLTARGDRVVAQAARVHGSSRAGLEALEALAGSPTRFVDAYPGWTPVALSLARTYEPAEPIIGVLERERSLTLPELVVELAQTDPEYVVETFLQTDADDVECSHSDLATEAALDRASTYRGQAVYQLKSLLFHCGVLTQRGADTSRLEPTADVWGLESLENLDSEVDLDVA